MKMKLAFDSHSLPWFLLLSSKGKTAANLRGFAPVPWGRKWSKGNETPLAKWMKSVRAGSSHWLCCKKTDMYVLVGLWWVIVIQVSVWAETPCCRRAKLFIFQSYKAFFVHSRYGLSYRCHRCPSFYAKIEVAEAGCFTWFPMFYPGSGWQGRSACGAPNTMVIKHRGCLETGLPRVKLAKALPKDEDVFAS